MRILISLLLIKLAVSQSNRSFEKRRKPAHLVNYNGKSIDRNHDVTPEGQSRIAVTTSVSAQNDKPTERKKKDEKPSGQNPPISTAWQSGTSGNWRADVASHIANQNGKPIDKKQTKIRPGEFNEKPSGKNYVASSEGESDVSEKLRVEPFSLAGRKDEIPIDQKESYTNSNDINGNSIDETLEKSPINKKSDYVNEKRSTQREVTRSVRRSSRSQNIKEDMVATKGSPIEQLEKNDKNEVLVNKMPNGRDSEASQEKPARLFDRSRTANGAEKLGAAKVEIAGTSRFEHKARIQTGTAYTFGQGLEEKELKKYRRNINFQQEGNEDTTERKSDEYLPSIEKSRSRSRIMARSKNLSRQSFGSEEISEIKKRSPSSARRSAVVKKGTSGDSRQFSIEKSGLQSGRARNQAESGSMESQGNVQNNKIRMVKKPKESKQSNSRPENTNIVDSNTHVTKNLGRVIRSVSSKKESVTSTSRMQVNHVKAPQSSLGTSTSARNYRARNKAKNKEVSNVGSNVNNEKRKEVKRRPWPNTISDANKSSPKTKRRKVKGQKKGSPYAQPPISDYEGYQYPIQQPYYQAYPIRQPVSQAYQYPIQQPVYQVYPIRQPVNQAYQYPIQQPVYQAYQSPVRIYPQSQYVSQNQNQNIKKPKKGQNIGYQSSAAYNARPPYSAYEAAYNPRPPSSVYQAAYNSRPQQNLVYSTARPQQYTNIAESTNTITSNISSQGQNPPTYTIQQPIIAQVSSQLSGSNQQYLNQPQAASFANPEPVTFSQPYSLSTVQAPSSYSFTNDNIQDPIPAPITYPQSFFTPPEEAVQNPVQEETQNNNQQSASNPSPTSSVEVATPPTMDEAMRMAPIEEFPEESNAPAPLVIKPPSPNPIDMAPSTLSPTTVDSSPWITTEKIQYAPCEFVAVKWYRGKPEINDTIAITYFDDEVLEFLTIFEYVICEEESCLNLADSQWGDIEINTEPDLEPGLYYVSLFDSNKDELSYIDLEIVEDLFDCNPTSFPSSLPSQRITSMPTKSDSNVPSRIPTENPTTAAPTPTKFTRKPSDVASSLPTLFAAPLSGSLATPTPTSSSSLSSQRSNIPGGTIIRAPTPSLIDMVGVTLSPTATDDTPWITTDTAQYAPCDVISIAWYKGYPEIGDNIVITYFDDPEVLQILDYKSVMSYVICEDESCLLMSQNGVIEFNPEPDLSQGTYYISLYNPDMEELSYIDFEIVDGLKECSPTASPTEYPTSSPTGTRLPTKQQTRFPTRRQTEAPTRLPTKSATMEPTIPATPSPTVFPTATPTKPPVYSPDKVIQRPTPSPMNTQATLSPTDPDMIPYITTDSYEYAPCDKIYIEWFKGMPEIGDSIKISFFDEASSTYRTVLEYVICDNKDCVVESQSGYVEFSPDTDLVIATYYVSLFDAQGEEASYIDFIIRDGLRDCTPTDSPTPWPTRYPTKSATLMPISTINANTKSDEITVTGTSKPPTPSPASDPTPSSTSDPTPSSTSDPNPSPTSDPTLAPIRDPTKFSTVSPTNFPTQTPVKLPTFDVEKVIQRPTPFPYNFPLTISPTDPGSSPWITTDLYEYAPCAKIFIEWFKGNPEIGDNFGVGYFNTESDKFHSVLEYVICNEKDCLERSQSGYVQFSPDSHLLATTYYVSLYTADNVEIAYIDFIVNEDLKDCDPTESPTPWPTLTPIKQTPWPTWTTKSPTPWPTWTTKSTTPWPTWTEKSPTPWPTWTTKSPTPWPTSTLIPPTPWPTKQPIPDPVEVLDDVGQSNTSPIIAPTVSLNTMTPTTVDTNRWILTNFQDYAPCETIYVEWYNGRPNIGDNIAISLFDPELSQFRDVYQHTICKESNCVSASETGIVEVYPEPEWMPATYYVSLYSEDRTEMSFTIINVIDGLVDCSLLQPQNNMEPDTDSFNGAAELTTLSPVASITSSPTDSPTRSPTDSTSSPTDSTSSHDSTISPIDSTSSPTGSLTSSPSESFTFSPTMSLTSNPVLVTTIPPQIIPLTSAPTMPVASSPVVSVSASQGLSKDEKAVVPSISQTDSNIFYTLSPTPMEGVIKLESSAPSANPIIGQTMPSAAVQEPKTLSPTVTGALPWISTDKAAYAPCETIIVEWYRGKPEIGDNVAITAFNPETSMYQSIYTHIICNEESCLAASQSDIMDVTPEPELTPATYYLSLFDSLGVELGYVDFVVIDGIADCSETQGSGQTPTSAPINTGNIPAAQTTYTTSPTYGNTNWVTTNRASYLQGEPITIEFYRSKPMIGDSITISFFDSTIFSYRYVMVHFICEEESCLADAQKGEIVFDPPEYLDPALYYVSLYDPDESELSFIDIIVDKIEES